MNSQLYYERLSQGELSAQDASADQRIQSLKDNDRAFLTKHPLLPRPKRRPLFGPPILVWGTPLLAATLLVAFFVLPQDDIRMKGTPGRLLVYSKTSQGPEQVRDGVTLTSGAEIQIAYLLPKNWYSAILSIDGNGSVTRHWPREGDWAVQTETEGIHLLPYSFRLDDAPRFETVFLFMSKDPFGLEGLEVLNPPRNVAIDAFHIVKKE